MTWYFNLFQGLAPYFGREGAILIAFFAPFVLLGLFLLLHKMFTGERKRAPTDATDASAKNAIRDTKKIPSDMVGTYLGPVWMLFFIRPVVSVIVGTTVSGLFVAIDWLLEANVFDWQIFGLTTLLLGGLTFRSDKELLVVPPNHVAILLLFGGRIPVYLKEGAYDWWGRRLRIFRIQIFGVNRTAIGGMDEPGKNIYPDTPGEADGFVFIGDRVLQIWQSAKDKNTSLSNIARGGSTIFTKITITIHTVNPMLWMKSSDPVLRVAEQTRTGFRMAIELFRSLNIAGLQNAIRNLMKGMGLFTTFIRDRVDAKLEYSVVCDEADLPMYDTIDESEGDTWESTRARFKEKLSKKANLKHLEASKGKDGKPVITYLSLEDALVFVTTKVGAFISGISMSDIDLNEIEAKVANQASAEGLERQVALATADTQAEARNRLQLKPDETNDVLARLLAASNDGTPGINYVFVPGEGNQLVRAAVAGGAQIGGGST